MFRRTVVARGASVLSGVLMVSAGLSVVGGGSSSAMAHARCRYRGLHVGYR